MKYILFLLLLTSCISEQRCIDKYKWSKQSDTIIKSIIIPKDSLRTIFNTDTLKVNDTIIIEKNRVKIKYYKGKDSLIYIQANCEEIVKKDTTINKYIKKEGLFIPTKRIKQIQFIVIIIIVILITGYFYQTFHDKSKKP